MRQTRNPSVFLLLLVVSVLFASPAFTQVTAGIRANGQVVNHGDTVRVCEGSSISYLSSAQGSLLIDWFFTGSATANASGLGPFNVLYPKAGFYTTKQVITGGNMTDSMEVIVEVSNNKPAA